MAVKTALSSSKGNKYKVQDCSEDASVCLSDCPDTSYIKVNHATHTERVCTRSGWSATCTIVAVLVVSLTLNVAVVVYICTDRPKTDTPRPAPHSDRLVSAVHKDSLCIDCTTLPSRRSSSADYSQLSRHRLEDGSYLCCMQNVASLQKLFQLFADRMSLLDSDNLPNGTRGGSTTGAHLYADSDALKKTPPTLSWSDEYGFGAAYVSNVIRDDNQLLVKKAGLYHVYSFFTFKTLQHRVTPDNVLHTVYRQNRKLERLGSHVMLLDKTTLPEETERFVTSFLSATVRLRQDDQLYVKVSNLSYVYPFAPSNFFGLFYVGN